MKTPKDMHIIGLNEQIYLNALHIPIRKVENKL